MEKNKPKNWLLIISLVIFGIAAIVLFVNFFTPNPYEDLNRSWCEPGGRENYEKYHAYENNRMNIFVVYWIILSVSIVGLVAALFHMPISAQADDNSSEQNQYGASKDMNTTNFNPENNDDASFILTVTKDFHDNDNDTETSSFSTYEEAKTYFDKCVVEAIIAFNKTNWNLDPPIIRSRKRYFVIYQDEPFLNIVYEIILGGRKVD